MRRCVSIIDYGMGNLYSISNAIKALGFEPKMVERVEDLTGSERLILPGVGAYRDAMSRLANVELNSAICDFVREGKPLLGICLGMQLLFQHSEENGGVAGLGVISGGVHRFPNTVGYRIPQIQWNEVKPGLSSKMFNGAPGGDYFYFLHSYYIKPTEPAAVVSASNYCGISYCSAIEKNNIWGMQFHPEKSGPSGLKLLSRFLQQEN